MAFERPIQELEAQLREFEELSDRSNLDASAEIAALRARIEASIDAAYADLSPWDRVNVARHPERPVASDYIAGAMDDFFELHGDRAFGDDRAIVTGFAQIEDHRFLLVGHRKGRTMKERLACNFGCAHPEGYRKALRKMQLAARMGLPIVSLINTPGAYPGIGAEERGQAGAIAENILEMFRLEVPILAIVIGEGGSGGALGIGVGDRVLIMEYSYYSVISPEGCAAILWKDGERTPDAASALRLTAPDLIELGVVDGVIKEPSGGAHRDRQRAIDGMRGVLLEELRGLKTIPKGELLSRRRAKYRHLAAVPGRFPESGAATL
ncbi:MAG: acetyl-CoA carboxylase carboxyltransferase subunit alpha [Planctomycetes bacterium]|nr:acetyl-CoA carboxylase carboxyltransferase subunit alpha [Planctomycetota bacterium]